MPVGSLLSACSFFLLPTSTSPTVLAGILTLNGAGFALVSTGGLVAVMEARSGANAGSIMSWYTGFIGAGYAVAGFAGGATGDWLGLQAGIRLLALVPLATGLVMVAALQRIPSPLAATPGEGTAPTRWISRFRNLGPIVWLAFFVAVHINLLNGVLLTYFPLFGLTIGLSLTRIGALSGMHSAAASVIRFVAPLIFRVVTPRRSLSWMVVLGGSAVAALAISVRFWILAMAWLIIGLSRGVLRVSSAALVMDSSGHGRSERGPASGIYMAGLDVGRIIGPLIGGLGVQSLGFSPTFILAGLGFPVVFLVMNAHLSRRDAHVET